MPMPVPLNDKSRRPEMVRETQMLLESLDVNLQAILQERQLRDCIPVKTGVICLWGMF
jgi:hypothetical protein